MQTWRANERVQTDKRLWAHDAMKVIARARAHVVFGAPHPFPYTYGYRVQLGGGRPAKRDRAVGGNAGGLLSITCNQSVCVACVHRRLSREPTLLRPG